MRRALLAAAAAAAAAAPAPAAAATASVSIFGSAYHPTPLTVLVGDEVTWRNGDFLEHVVQADDGSFGSLPLSDGAAFSHAFESAGRFTYYCTIHTYMHGEVDAAPILLDAPAGPVLLGGEIALRGRAQAGVASVALAREGAGAGEPPIVAPVAADGTFSARVRILAAGRWRASAGTLQSPPVSVPVVTRQRLLVRATGAGLSVRTVPPRPRARIVVERYWRERFAWDVVARTRLDGRGRARVPLGRAARAPGRLQVVLAPADGLPRSAAGLRVH